MYNKNKIKSMKKMISERSKKSVENVIESIKKGEMSIFSGYDKFVNNGNGKAFVYYIDRLIELNMAKIVKGRLIAK